MIPLAPHPSNSHHTQHNHVNNTHTSRVESVAIFIKTTSRLILGWYFFSIHSGKAIRMAMQCDGYCDIMWRLCHLNAFEVGGIGKITSTWVPIVSHLLSTICTKKPLKFGQLETTCGLCRNAFLCKHSWLTGWEGGPWTTPKSWRIVQYSGKEITRPSASLRNKWMTHYFISWASLYVVYLA